jgi:hypothetical protein
LKNKLILILVLSFVLTISNSVFANDNLSNKNIDLNNVEEQLIQSGTDPKIAASLIKKLENGEQWDSMNPNKKPVSITKEKKGNDVFINLVYQDRSNINVSLTGGKYTSGSGYVNWTGRLVRATNNFNFDSKYNVNYTYADNNYDCITSVYNMSIDLVGGTVSQTKLKIVKSTENSSGPAEGRLSAFIQYSVPPSVGYRSLSVSVGNDTAYPTWNEFY